MKLFQHLIYLTICMITIGGVQSISFAQSVPNLVVAENQITGPIYSVDWNFSGEYLAVASRQGFKIYNAGLQELATLYPNQIVSSADWHPSLPRLAVTVGTNIEIWDWNSDTNSLSQVAIMPSDKGQVFVQWNLDGSRLASFGIEATDSTRPQLIGYINIWDGNNFTLRLLVPDRYIYMSLGDPIPNILAWSPQQASILAGVGNGIIVQSDGSILIETDIIVYTIDTNTGNRIGEMPLRSPYSLGLSFAWQTGGSYVAVGAASGASIFNYNTGEWVTGLAGNHFDITSLSWSPDGRYLISEYSLFDIQTFELVGAFEAEDVTANAWNPDGIHVTIGTSDGHISIQDASAFPEFEPITCSTTVPCAVDSFTLINADTTTDIGVLNDNDTIDLAVLGTSNLAIRANTIPTTVGSTVFDLNGIGQTDDTMTYDFTNWTPSVGSYTLTATPYSDAGGTGTAGMPLTINFTVVDNTPNPTSTPTLTPTPSVNCDVTIASGDTVALVDAINIGNNSGSLYTICLENSTYTFNTADNSNPLGANALPVITGEIKILGNGATITRDTSAPDVHIFRVADGATLTLENLTLNGRDPIDNAGTVRLRAVTLVGDSGGE